MPSFYKKQAKAVAELHFSANVDKTLSSPANVWLSNEDVRGHALFRLPPGVNFSHSKIALRGTITLKTDDCPGALQRSWRTETLPFLGVALDSKAGTQFKPDGGAVKIPFRFNLEDVHTQTRSPVVAELPPSLNYNNERTSWSNLRKQELDAQYEITYTITASVFDKRGLQASTTKNVSVLPVSQVQPPLSPSDFPMEYHFAAATAPHPSLSLKRAPSFGMEVAGQEPEAIVLNPHESISAGSTLVPFVVKALPRLPAAFELGALPTQVQLRARLVTKTLITPDRIEEKAIPTIEQARNAQNSTVRVSKSDEQEFTVALPRWEHIAPDSAEQFALSKFSFIFNLTRDQAPIPTFFTPLLSRRYALEVALSFPGTSSPNLKLSLPLQITYEVDEYDYIKPPCT